MGHSRGDPPHGPYRSKAEVDRWRERDPLDLLADAAGIDDGEVAAAKSRADLVVQAALAFARDSAEPADDRLESDVWG
jgi:TPP-dependent pyruvate/acetoin dehydrogenase alpha subunit